MPDKSVQLKPSNIEAEQALLGALLLNNEVIGKLPAGFVTEMFYEPLHQRIYDIATREISEGRLVSPVTLKLRLADDEGLKELGGTSYLARLAGATISITSAPDYARLIRELWVRREAIEALEEGVARLAGHGGDDAPHVILEATQGALSVLAASASPSPLIHTQRAALSDAMEHTQRGFANDGKPILSTGLSGIDDLIGGFMPADHVVLMGESSMGKTALAICMARAVMSQRGGVFFGSLEMQKGQIAHRIVSMELFERGHRIEYLDLIKGSLTEERFRQALEVARSMEGDAIVYAEDDARSLPRLMTAAHTALKHFASTDTPLKLIVIDYLQLVRVPDAKTREQEIAAAACGMKALAKMTGVPVVSLSQMNRGDKEKRPRRPTKERARGSGEIEESCDVMIGCYRESYYLTRDIQGCADDIKRSEMIATQDRVEHVIEFNTMKNRRGPISTVFGWCDLPVNIIRDQSPDHQEQGEF